MQSFVLIQTTVAAAEELSAQLWEQSGILGIEELPADGGDIFTVDSAHQFVRFDERARYEAWLRTEAFQSGVSILLKVYLADGTILPAQFVIVGRGTVEPSDYLAAMRAQHHGRVIGKFWVGPPWETPVADKIPVIIEPGMAFGLGDHPTTQMCLELLAGLSRNTPINETPHPVPTPQTDVALAPASPPNGARRFGPAVALASPQRGRQVRVPATAGGTGEGVSGVPISAPRRILDIGTGTGILAIAAARLFPDAELWLTDFDPECRSSVENNFALNGLPVPAHQRYGVRPLPAGPFDLVLSNVYLEALKSLVPRIHAGAWIVSGLLGAEQLAEFRSVAEMRFDCRQVCQRADSGTWFAAALCRRQKIKTICARLVLEGGVCGGTVRPACPTTKLKRGASSTIRKAR